MNFNDERGIQKKSTFQNMKGSLHHWEMYFSLSSKSSRNVQSLGFLVVSCLFFGGIISAPRRPTALLALNASTWFICFPLLNKKEERTTFIEAQRVDSTSTSLYQATFALAYAELSASRSVLFLRAKLQIILVRRKYLLTFLHFSSQPRVMHFLWKNFNLVMVILLTFDRIWSLLTIVYYDT